MLDFVMDEHIHWRRDFHPSDKPVVSLLEQRKEPYQTTLMRTEEALMELSSRLKAGSVPAFSPRYLGHMISDTLMAANLGYLATILYNPNNCSYDVSSTSTELELEVGKQMASLFGYDPERAWGHITSGGTIANYEALWVARNLKSLGQALVRCHPELFHQHSAMQRANLPLGEVVDLMAALKSRGEFAALREETAQYTGSHAGLGKLLVPASKHYSWVKAADILGLGQNSLIFVPVDEFFRMDMVALRTKVLELVESETPILGVVAVAGTTEVGAVDALDEIVALREELESERGVGFYLHLDAAYGGYARAIFLDEDGEYLDLERMKSELDRTGALPLDVPWPSRSTYNAYSATPQVDSITVDPHKLGYVPYAAGGIVMKDRRVLDMVSYFASYVFDEEEIAPHLLGSFIMEGSKPGASAASVWMAHRVLPLNLYGYGQLLGQSIVGAQEFYTAVEDRVAFEVLGVQFAIEPLVRPDLNIVDFALVEVGNSSLKETNKLNSFLYDQCSYRSGPVYLEDFILSKTVLERKTYGASVDSFLNRLGIPEGEWQSEERLFLLRSCMMTPYLTSNLTFERYCQRFWNALERHLSRFVMERKLSSS